MKAKLVALVAIAMLYGVAMAETTKPTREATIGLVFIDIKTGSTAKFACAPVKEAEPAPQATPPTKYMKVSQ